MLLRRNVIRSCRIRSCVKLLQNIMRLCQSEKHTEACSGDEHLEHSLSRAGSDQGPSGPNCNPKVLLSPCCSQIFFRGTLAYLLNACRPKIRELCVEVTSALSLLQALKQKVQFACVPAKL